MPARFEQVFLQFDRKLVELVARLTARSLLVMHAPPPQVVKRDKNFAIGARFLLAASLAQCPNLRSLLLLEPTQSTQATQVNANGLALVTEGQKMFGARISIVREEVAKAILCEQQQQRHSVSLWRSATSEPEQPAHRSHTRDAHTRAASEPNAHKLPHFSR